MLPAEQVQRILAGKAARAQAATNHQASLPAVAAARTAARILELAEAVRAYENCVACHVTDYRVLDELAPCPRFGGYVASR